MANALKSSAALGAALAALYGCGGTQSALGSAPSQTRALSAYPEVVITLANYSNVKIHLDRWTQPMNPVGRCPWVTNQGPPPTLIPGITSPIVLMYGAACQANEPNTFSIQYGADLLEPDTVCTWSVTYAGGFAYSVNNGSRTKCRFAFDSSDNSEYFYYYRRGAKG